MIPASFAKAGFVAPVKPKYRRLMIATEGPPNTGKSEFILSSAGPGIMVCLDRQGEAVLDNPDPPSWRNPDFVIKNVTIPLNLSTTKENYLEHWKALRETTYAALAIPEARTVGLDGDSDGFELQTLGEFGKLTQIPAIMRTGLNAARRLFVSRLYDSGKIIIATNKIKKVYADKIDPVTGTPVMYDGKPVREWDGTYERQGFSDHGYLWQVQLLHLYDEEKQQFGIRILEAKANMSLKGQELWGDDCNMQSLVQFIYPHYPLSDWGF